MHVGAVKALYGVCNNECPNDMPGDGSYMDISMRVLSSALGVCNVYRPLLTCCEYNWLTRMARDPHSRSMQPW